MAAEAEAISMVGALWKLICGVFSVGFLAGIWLWLTRPIRHAKKRTKELADYIARVQRNYPDPEEAEKITRLTAIDGGKRK